ncbi:hypothetical protein U1Q18_036658 [Sarracenia purpurea var. burkii]
MTVEEIRGSSGSESDRFPVGMRVLAVDDDPTCLTLLGGLLRKCQYQVTTTGQAKMALKILRENKNRFDLVISDVHMPDMDGFKLLEHVGLEMDLPVIMLSANSDTKLVMKGITHGACDYLVKPIRIEELKNIWQHVIRRKKFDSKSSNLDTTHEGNGDGGKRPASTENVGENGKLNRKRKDEEEEEDYENEQENEDPAIQKKPRVVWSIELHRKFVAAVNQLGFEKAVPKRILDLMNVEGITRENVASHLQKYRLYLKRISSMAAAVGGWNSSSMPMSSQDRFGDFQTMSGRGRLLNPGLSYQTGGIFGRLNSPAGVSPRSLSSFARIQPIHAQNLVDSVVGSSKLQPVVSPTDEKASLFQAIPTRLELDQLQQRKCTSHVEEFSFAGDPTIFVPANTFADNIAPIGSSSMCLPSTSNNPILQGIPQQTQSAGVFDNQSSFKVISLSSEPLYTAIGGSNFLDNGRCNENWQSTIQGLSETCNNDQLLPYSMKNNSSSTGLHIEGSRLGFSSTKIISAPIPIEGTGGVMQCHAGLVGGDIQNMNQAIDQRWGEIKQDYTQYSNPIFSTFNSMVPGDGVKGSLLSPVLDQNSGVYNRKIGASLVRQSNSSTSTLHQLTEIEKSTMESSKMRSNGNSHLEQAKSLGSLVHNGYDSFDDLMHAALVEREQDGTMLMDGEFGFDAYSFGSCL